MLFPMFRAKSSTRPELTDYAGRAPESAFVVIADRNWPPTTPDEERCHYCPSPFEYRIYGWNSELRSWSEDHKFTGAKQYSDA
jgi:hypothetical protein